MEMCIPVCIRYIYYVQWGPGTSGCISVSATYEALTCQIGAKMLYNKGNLISKVGLAMHPKLVLQSCVI